MMGFGGVLCILLLCAFAVLMNKSVAVAEAERLALKVLKRQASSLLFFNEQNNKKEKKEKKKGKKKIKKNWKSFWLK